VLHLRPRVRSGETAVLQRTLLSLAAAISTAEEECYVTAARPAALRAGHTTIHTNKSPPWDVKKRALQNTHINNVCIISDI